MSDRGTATSQPPQLTKPELRILRAALDLYWQGTNDRKLDRLMAKIERLIRG